MIPTPILAIHRLDEVILHFVSGLDEVTKCYPQIGRSPFSLRPQIGRSLRQLRPQIGYVLRHIKTYVLKRARYAPRSFPAGAGARSLRAQPYSPLPGSCPWTGSWEGYAVPL